MKNRTSKEWIWPPADQWISVWGLLTLAVVAFVTSKILDFFTQLSGMPWIFCYFIALGIATFGAGLIFYAKLPLYRERHFFTFGPGAVPEPRRSLYRWGYCCAILGALLMGC